MRRFAQAWPKNSSFDSNCNVKVWYCLSCHLVLPLTLWVSGTPLGPQTLTLSYFGFLSFVLGHPKHVGPGYGLSGHMSSISRPVTIASFSRPVVKIKFRCDTSHDILTMMSWFWVFGPIGAPIAQFVISWLPELRFRSSKAFRTWLWPLWTHVFHF